jgi:hypothetical protein
MFLSSAIGLGVGPLLTGMLSDRYASALFTGSGYRATCLDHATLAATAEQVRSNCATALGLGVRFAIATVALGNLVAATMYVLAARRLRGEDLATTLQGAVVL